MVIDERYKEPPLPLESTLADWYDRNAAGEDDHYTQPGNLFRQVLTETDRQHLIDNIMLSMQGIAGPQREAISPASCATSAALTCNSVWASPQDWALMSASFCRQ